MFVSCNGPKNSRVGWEEKSFSFFLGGGGGIIFFLKTIHVSCQLYIVVMQCSNPLFMLIGSWKGWQKLWSFEFLIKNLLGLH